MGQYCVEESSRRTYASQSICVTHICCKFFVCVQINYISIHYNSLLAILKIKNRESLFVASNWGYVARLLAMIPSGRPISGRPLSWDEAGHWAGGGGGDGPVLP